VSQEIVRYIVVILHRHPPSHRNTGGPSRLFDRYCTIPGGPAKPPYPSTETNTGRCYS
jgi:hypothetical protein